MKDISTNNEIILIDINQEIDFCQQQLQSPSTSHKDIIFPTHLLIDNQPIIYSYSLCCLSSQKLIIPQNSSPKQNHIKYYKEYLDALILYKNELYQQVFSQLLGIFLTFIIFSMIKFWLASFGHSGYQNGPTYGDFEAQRHWMELTVSLPFREWYIETIYNPLTWWRLDYPPVSAYWAYITGLFAQKIYPKMIELESSRGIEDDITRIIMHLTVLIGDFIIYLPGVIAITDIITRNYHLQMIMDYFHVNIVYILSDKNNHTSNTITQNNINDFLLEKKPLSFFVLFFLLFSQPLLLIIDHGHFQYNSICLGLLLLTLSSSLQQKWFQTTFFFITCCLFKQTGLYYSLSFFCYIIGSLWYSNTSALYPHQNHFFERFIYQQAVTTATTTTTTTADTATTSSSASDSHINKKVNNSHSKLHTQQQKQHQQQSHVTPTPVTTTTALPTEYTWSKLPQRINFWYYKPFITILCLIILTISLFFLYFLPFIIDGTTQITVPSPYDDTTYITLYEQYQHTFKLVQYYIAISSFDIYNTIVSYIQQKISLSECIYTLYTISYTFIIACNEIFLFSYKNIFPYIIDLFKISILPIIQRIFPIQRGLFEDKVSSIWCATNLFIKWGKKFPIPILAKMSLCLTLLLLLPSVLHLLYRPTRYGLCLSITIGGLAFYLASMQVHEKTIMYAMIPMTLLIYDFPLLVLSMTYATTATCYFLLIRDGQFIPFIVIQTIVGYIVLYSATKILYNRIIISQKYDWKNTIQFCIHLGIIIGIVIAPVIAYIAKVYVHFPERYPHIPEVFLVWYGAILFTYSWGYLTYQQFSQ